MDRPESVKNDQQSQQARSLPKDNHHGTEGVTFDNVPDFFGLTVSYSTLFFALRAPIKCIATYGVLKGSFLVKSEQFSQNLAVVGAVPEDTMLPPPMSSAIEPAKRPELSKMTQGGPQSSAPCRIARPAKRHA